MEKYTKKEWKMYEAGAEKMLEIINKDMDWEDWQVKYYREKFEKFNF